MLSDDLREELKFTPTKQDAELKKQEITVTITLATGGTDGVTV